MKKGGKKTPTAAAAAAVYSNWDSINDQRFEFNQKLDELLNVYSYRR